MTRSRAPGLFDFVRRLNKHTFSAGCGLERKRFASQVLCCTGTDPEYNILRRSIMVSAASCNM